MMTLVQTDDGRKESKEETSHSRWSNQQYQAANNDRYQCEEFQFVGDEQRQQEFFILLFDFELFTAPFDCIGRIWKWIRKEWWI